MNNKFWKSKRGKRLKPFMILAFILLLASITMTIINDIILSEPNDTLHEFDMIVFWVAFVIEAYCWGSETQYLYDHK